MSPQENILAWAGTILLCVFFLALAVLLVRGIIWCLTPESKKSSEREADRFQSFMDFIDGPTVVRPTDPNSIEHEETI
jgi:hypothetical protein